MTLRGRHPGARLIGRWYSAPVAVPLALVVAFLVGLPVYAEESDRRPPSEPTHPSRMAPVRFTDAHRQAAEFISYYKSIALTAEQQRVMAKGLSSIRAPCCRENSIATCCCPCNLAKSAWGLSKLLIARHGADAGQVQAAVTDWLQFVNPGGYTGDACFTRGCNRPFEKNGCGGMDDRHVVQ